MTRRFETLTNHTLNLLRLSYWTKRDGRNQTDTIDIAPGKTIDVPTDDTCGEFFVEAEDYSRLMKFRTEIAADGNWMWTYDDSFEFPFDPSSKNIGVGMK